MKYDLNKVSESTGAILDRLELLRSTPGIYGQSRFAAKIRRMIATLSAQLDLTLAIRDIIRPL